MQHDDACEQVQTTLTTGRKVFYDNHLKMKVRIVFSTIIFYSEDQKHVSFDIDKNQNELRVRPCARIVKNSSKIL